MPFFRRVFVDEFDTPSFRRISPPTISKPPNGMRLSYLKTPHRMPDSRSIEIWQGGAMVFRS
jgi:hypothetical protein